MFWFLFLDPWNEAKETLLHTTYTNLTKSKGGRAGESYELYDCIDTKFPKRQKESTVLEVRIVLPSGKEGGSDAGERYQGVGEGLELSTSSSG